MDYGVYFSGNSIQQIRLINPDSNQSFGQRWHLVGHFVVPSLADNNIIAPTSCCSSDQRHVQYLVQRRPNVVGPFRNVY